MHTRLVRALSCAMLFLLVNALSAEDKRLPRPIGGVDWHTDLYDAHVESVKLQRPMLIVFGASWCGYCRKLEKETLSDRSVTQFVKAGFVPVHLDLEHDGRIAKILDVKSIPCTVVLSPQADLLGRQVGYVDADRFQGLLQSVRQTGRATVSATGGWRVR